MSNKLEHPATMRDVARAAGVSVATVSYVVNGGPRPVSTHNRRRVLAAIDQLGYEVRRRPAELTIGVVVPDATNLFFSRAVAGLQAALGARQYLLVSSTGENPARERELLDLLVRRTVAGLILTPCAGLPDDALRIAERGTPVVVMDRSARSTPLNAVTMNNYGSAAKATRLLIDSGHRRIALLNGPQRVDTAEERRTGYVDTLRAAGLPVEPQYVRGVEFGRERAATAAHELLSLDTPPEAIFSTSPVLTTGLLIALRERGLRWPDDAAIVGFGEASWAELLNPPLTVVEQPAERMGTAAAELLLSVIKGAGPRTGQRIVLESQIVLRDSHWGRRHRER